jgi:hypothetical protein
MPDLKLAHNCVQHQSYNTTTSVKPSYHDAYSDNNTAFHGILWVYDRHLIANSENIKPNISAVQFLILFLSKTIYWKLGLVLHLSSQSYHPANNDSVSYTYYHRHQNYRKYQTPTIPSPQLTRFHPDTQHV